MKEAARRAASKAGAAGSVLDMVRSAQLNHQVEAAKAVLADEVRELLMRFS